MAQDDIQGTVVDASGDPIENAIVELTRSYQSDPPTEETVVRTTTDSNGNYIFNEHPDGDGSTLEYHVSCYNYDGSAYVNSENNPGVTADLISIPDSPVLRWSLSEGTGTTAGDSIGSNDLSINGASWITGTYQDDYALEFATDDSAIAASKVTTISETNSFSIGITVDNADYNSAIIAEQLDGDSTGFTIGGADGNLCVRDWDNDSVSDNAPPTGKTRILVTWDTASLSLYVNTTQKTDGDICSNGNAEGNLRLGEGNGDPGFHYDGITDDVVVYDSVLTSSQIQQDYDIQPWS